MWYRLEILCYFWKIFSISELIFYVFCKNNLWFMDLGNRIEVMYYKSY